tara:strand:+ start:241 stop:402 length:162 start_codon:yes stop_codon:yes gene_type:complete
LDHHDRSHGVRIVIAVRAVVVIVRDADGEIDVARAAAMSPRRRRRDVASLRGG